MKNKNNHKPIDKDYFDKILLIDKEKAFELLNNNKYNNDLVDFKDEDTIITYQIVENMNDFSYEWIFENQNSIFQVIFKCDLDFMKREKTIILREDFSGWYFLGDNYIFTNAYFNGKKTNFSDMYFNSKIINFSYTHFNGENTYFTGTHFNAKEIDFSYAQFNGESTIFTFTHFDNIEITNFFNTFFNGQKTYFTGTHFNCYYLNFRESYFNSTIDLTNIKTFAFMNDFRNIIFNAKCKIDIQKFCKEENITLDPNKLFLDRILISAIIK